MLERKTIEKDEEYLRQISTPIDFEKDNYLEWIKELKDYCENNRVYALAPVQIGIPKRIVYLRNTTSDMSKNLNSNYNENLVMINPKIIESKGKTEFWEICASCCKKNKDTSEYIYLAGKVTRPYFIKVAYYDIDKVYHEEEFTEFKATVFSHEYDHLNGVLHIDLTDNIKEVKYDEMKKLREDEPYKILSEK